MTFALIFIVCSVLYALLFFATSSPYLRVFIIGAWIFLLAYTCLIYRKTKREVEAIQERTRMEIQNLQKPATVEESNAAYTA